MHTFRIVEEQGRWTVELGAGMSAPCKSRAAAIAQAEQIAQAIRRHGEVVFIVLPECIGSEKLAEPPGLARLKAARRLQYAK
jgi:hypothetical protein